VTPTRPVSPPSRSQRVESFGQDHKLTSVDRLGRWLSTRRIRRAVGDVSDKTVADIGCGYRADFARQLFADAAEMVLVDVSIDPSLRTVPRTRVIEEHLPNALAAIASDTLHVAICNNVIEHLWEAELTVAELHRVLRPGAVLVVNVPSWWGKFFLELAAFRLRLAPAAEMDDHKMYYDPRDLWPLLVKAGFLPSRISCRRHKLGLNTIAICRK